MAKDVRARMIAGAARLLSANGLEGTSFAEVLELTGAPRGSVYHHFPGGKTELVVEAVRFAGGRAITALRALPDPDPRETIDAFSGLWRQLLVGGQYDAGCAVAAVTVGAGDSEQLLAATAEVFRSWIEEVASLLVQGGVGPARARSIAVTTIAAMEGAVIVSRSVRSMEPFDQVADELRTLVAPEGSG